MLSFLHFSFLVGSLVTSQNAAVTKTVLLHIQFASIGCANVDMN